MGVKSWLSDNAVGLASLSIAAVGGVSAFACGIGSAFEAYPVPMVLYTVALVLAGGVAGWSARSARERSKCRLEWLSPGEARAAGAFRQGRRRPPQVPNQEGEGATHGRKHFGT